MKFKAAYSALFVLSLIFCGCGVKGKPMPPLTPTPIGRGEPSFSKATEKMKILSPNKKIEGDFDEAPDFAPPGIDAVGK